MANEEVLWKAMKPNMFISFAMKEIVPTLRLCREQVTAQSTIKEKKKTRFSVMIHYNEHSLKIEHPEDFQGKFRQHRWSLHKKPAFHQKLEKCIPTIKKKKQK